jgi:hypothetical protein
LKNSKNIHALKAVSQNLMHENLSITDGVYGILSKTDVKNEMAALGIDVSNGNEVQELQSLIRRLLTSLEITKGM